jgi:hypothetical protein
MEVIARNWWIATCTGKSLISRRGHREEKTRTLNGAGCGTRGGY